MGEFVRIFEMSARDGLQNEARLVPAAEKIRLIDMLSDCGFRKLEATSFVSPKWVPQMADAAGVMAGIRRAPDVVYAVLVPNLKGYEAARAANADEIAVFASASETFSHKNINCSIAESLERFRPVLAAGAADGILVRGYVSCVTDCPYEGPVPPAAAVRVAAELLAMGCYEISLGDTIGQGTPATIAAMLDAVLEEMQAERLAGHYHDTGGRALDNILVSLEKGLRTFDAAVGGLGGCPFAPGAKGNVDTLAVAAMLADKGYETGLHRERLGAAARFADRLREERP
ncbi:hydroxymethylglutaryl-CoA lyase [Mesorhizobium sp. M1156]|uniref:hydroxymethylglutaryl-CoA lyase n=1 Tax=Mesorhizobium sp. M1156 TaxID=2957064 RepID=UPI00333BA922